MPTSDEIPEDLNVYKFILQLRQEALFISSERAHLQKLNEEIKQNAAKLLESTWITTKKKLLITTQREYAPLQLILLNVSKFVDSKAVLNFQCSDKIGSVLHILRIHPEYLAQCLVLGERLCDETNIFISILQSIITGLYGSFIVPEDVNHMVILLYELAKYHVKNDNLLKIIKDGSSFFPMLYFMFHEFLPPARYFLSASLEVPVLRLIASADYHLDIDSEKSVLRFQQDLELHNKFRDAVEYRNEVTKVLAEMTNLFIAFLRDNTLGFPKSLAWLIFRISHVISEKCGLHQSRSVVAELIFTKFICTAIVDPERYGICSLQITDITRHNLMQIAKILQHMAMNKHHIAGMKSADLYSLINTKAMNDYLDELLVEMEQSNELTEDSEPSLTREFALFTSTEINNLLTFLQKVHNPAHSKIADGKLGDVTIEEQLADLDSLLENYSKSFTPFCNGTFDSTNKRSHTFNSKNNISKLPETSQPSNVVLMFNLKVEYLNPVGLLSEEKILSGNGITMNSKACNGNEHKSFSNYPDEGSVGNTSDNLEAISEAASNHSVGSSLELENEDQNDNYSDMVSANVSGRGSPNISGRDTPSSQVVENEERVHVEARQAENIQQPSQLNRQIRSEIDDKFCKFEIKKLPEGDETVSLISETWSTDVLASDTEAAESQDNRSGFRLPDQAMVGNLIDLSETRSESAWSTDAMVSDTERLTEVDNDDVGSISQSDDAHSAAPSEDTRSENDENLLTLRQSNSNPFMSPSHSINSPNQEIKKVVVKTNIKLEQSHTDNNANTVVFNSSSSSNVLFMEFSNKEQIVFNSTPSVPNTPNDMKDGAGPSGLDDGVNEILLSNCSLNSSSSGSSSNSFENKSNIEVSDKWETKPWLNSSQSSLNTSGTAEGAKVSLNPILPSKKVNRKSTESTGAIPKSISFDISADKGDKYFDDDQRNKKGGFFGKLKIGFRNRRGKTFRASDEYQMENEQLLEKRTTSNFIKLNCDLTDGILAKYRTKSFGDDDTVKDKYVTSKVNRESQSSTETEIEENSNFVVFKRKMRLVLGNTTVPVPQQPKTATVKNKLETILRLELGRARNSGHASNIAKISEMLRWLKLFSEEKCNKLFTSMKEDYQERAVYIQYLVCSKQELLLQQSYLESLQQQIFWEKQKCDDYLATVYINNFLITKEQDIINFCIEFKELSLSDEKCECLHNFYSKLYDAITQLPLWQEMFKNKSSTVKLILERCILSKVYKNALYPNGDGDRGRDRVLQDHIDKLSKIISPDHPDLRIQEVFLRECPWLPSQEILQSMAAYRTPSDKLQCVLRCAKCIMDLLYLAQNGSATADDFTPVLVFVAIKANPPDLLSTIQFVNNYHQNLCGEEQYWWTQFCAAVEFIKTMDYSD